MGIEHSDSAGGTQVEKGVVFFASDFHLGLRGLVAPLQRERRIVSWLRRIGTEATALYLLGDIFDFWYEYRGVVPRGYTRFLGALSDLCDRGVEVHIFTGNHDVWMFDYLEREVGAVVYRAAQEMEIFGGRFYLAHGDGLGPTGVGYRVLRAVFHSHILQRLFAALVHPSFAMWLGSRWSHHSRYGKQHTHTFRGDAEPIAQYAISHPRSEQIDCFMVGHLHRALIHTLPQGNRLLILGDWIVNDTYARWDGETLRLLRFEEQADPIELASCSLGMGTAGGVLGGA